VCESPFKGIIIFATSGKQRFWISLNSKIAVSPLICEHEPFTIIVRKNDIHAKQRIHFPICITSFFKEHYSLQGRVELFTGGAKSFTGGALPPRAPPVATPLIEMRIYSKIKGREDNKQREERTERVTNERKEMTNERKDEGKKRCDRKSSEWWD
jgi:hypothetical protein